MAIVDRGVDSSKIIQFLRSKSKIGGPLPLSNRAESITLSYSEKEPVPLRGEPTECTSGSTSLPSSGSLTYTGEYISQINYSNGRTVNIIRDSSGVITSTTDGSTTYTFSRDSNGSITSWTVS